MKPETVLKITAALKSIVSALEDEAGIKPARRTRKIVHRVSDADRANVTDLARAKAERVLKRKGLI